MALLLSAEKLDGARRRGFQSRHRGHQFSRGS